MDLSDDDRHIGLSLQNQEELINKLNSLKNLQICGVMTIGKLDATKSETGDTFLQLNKLFEQLKPSFNKDFTEISMGMSNDYKLALECGATMVRVGRGCFE